MTSPAVFLDRDGTIIHDAGYLNCSEDVAMLPGAPEAIAELRRAGFRIVVVTNQSGVARGMFTVDAVDATNREMQRQLGAAARADAIYYCPYHPEGTVPRYTRATEMRKPGAGMLLQAAEELDLDLPASWMIGDRAGDTQAGRRAGCRTILLSADPNAREETADFVASSLAVAAKVILDEIQAVPDGGRRRI